MFSKKKTYTNATTTLEGTQGRYIRRASPPIIPSPSFMSTANPYVTSRKATTSSNGEPMRRINPNPATSLMHPGPATSATAVDIENNNCTRPHSNSIISSLSTCSAPMPIAEQHQYHSTEEEDDHFSPTTMANLSSQSFRTHDNKERIASRRLLTASHSIANVQSLADPSEPYISYNPQQRFISLQSLPQNCYGSDTLYEQRSDGDQSLPAYWSVEYTEYGRPYYVDHKNERTHWFHPYDNEELPPNWRKHFNPDTGVCYHNMKTGVMQYINPMIAVPRTESMLVSSRSTEDTAEELNIIQHEQVPEWLLLYSQADDSFDHLLKWDLFNTLQLTQYDLMMLKLFKQECFDTVKRQSGSVEECEEVCFSLPDKCRSAQFDVFRKICTTYSAESPIILQADTQAKRRLYYRTRRANDASVDDISCSLPTLLPTIGSVHLVPDWKCLEQKEAIRLGEASINAAEEQLENDRTMKIASMSAQKEAPQFDVPTADHEKVPAKRVQQELTERAEGDKRVDLKPPSGETSMLASALEKTIAEAKAGSKQLEAITSKTITVEADVPIEKTLINSKGQMVVEVLPVVPDCPVGEHARVQIIDGVEVDSAAPIAFTVTSPERCVQICRSNSLPSGARLSLLCRSAHFERLTGQCHLYPDALNPNGYLEYRPNAQVLYMEKICIADAILPVSCDDIFRRIPQHILFGHATDIVTTASELECIRECVEAKKTRHLDCRSLVFYPDFPSYNCILNIHTRITRAVFFVPEHVYRVDYVEIAPCASLPRAQLIEGPTVSVRSDDDTLLQRVENQKGLGTGIGMVSSDWSEWGPCDKNRKMRQRERICETCKDNVQIESCTVQNSIDDAIQQYLKEQAKENFEPSVIPSRQVARKPTADKSINQHIPFPSNKKIPHPTKTQNVQFFGPPFNKGLPDSNQLLPNTADGFRYR